MSVLWSAEYTNRREQWASTDFEGCDIITDHNTNHQSSILTRSSRRFMTLTIPSMQSVFKRARSRNSVQNVWDFQVDGIIQVSKVGRQVSKHLPSLTTNDTSHGHRLLTLIQGVDLSIVWRFVDSGVGSGSCGMLSRTDMYPRLSRRKGRDSRLRQDHRSGRTDWKPLRCEGDGS